MLDERALRKPGFVEGYPVTLADGQIWTLPKPCFRFKPKFSPNGKVEVAGGLTFGPESEGDLEVLYGATQDGGSEILRVKFSLAARLLRVNYNLTDDDLAELLTIEVRDGIPEERWDGISDALMGIAPKPLPAI